MIRTIAEYILGPIVVRRNLPSSVGVGVVIASARTAGLRYLFRRSGAIDPVLFKIVKSLVHRNDTVWDIGANVGLFAASAAAIAGSQGEIFAIEPDHDVFKLLSRTAGAQPATSAPIKPLPSAIDETCGVVNFEIARRSRATNHVVGAGSPQIGGTIERRLVPSLNLDSLIGVLTNPAVVKIDIEGIENRVIRGVKRLLQEIRPRLYVECARENSIEVANLLMKSSYRIYNGATGKPMVDGEGAPWDTVAMPE